MDVSKFNFDFDAECNKQQQIYIKNIKSYGEKLNTDDDNEFNKVIIESLEQSKLFCVNILKEYHNQLMNFLSNQ